MKKIFTLLALMLAVVSVQAKTDKQQSNGLTNNATNATITDTWTLGWTANNSNSARAFSGLSSSISNYKKLYINVASGSESTSYRVILYCNSRTTTNAYVGTYTGSTVITLADLNYTSGSYDNHGYDDINIICVAGNGNSGSVTFKEIYLETDEYDYLSITTPIANMSWYSYSDNTSYSTNNVTKQLNTSLGQNKIIYGPSSAGATSAYMDVSGYDKVNFTLSDAGDAGIRLMYGNATGNDLITIDTNASTTSYSASLSTMPKIGTIKTKNITVSDEITVSAIEFEKSLAATSTTTFNVASAITGNVAYDRTFTVGQKSTVCLPFALTESEVTAAGTFYTLGGVDSGKLTFTEVTTTEAYKPYIFVAKTEKPFASLSGKAIPATAANNTTVDGYTFTGLLAATSDIAADHSGNTVYGWSTTDGSFKKAGTGVSVNAFRAVIVGPASGSVRSLTASFGDDESTGISDRVREAASPDHRYNLQGQRVGVGHKGLVIIGGRKLLVK